MVPGSVPVTPDVGGFAASSGVSARVTIAAAVPWPSTTIIAASNPVTSIAASSTRSISSSRSIEPPSSPKSRLRRLSRSARSSACERSFESASIFTRISSTALTSCSLCSALGESRRTTTIVASAATAPKARTAITAVVDNPAPSPQPTPLESHNRALPLEKGYPSSHCTGRSGRWPGLRQREPGASSARSGAPTSPRATGRATAARARASNASPLSFGRHSTMPVEKVVPAGAERAALPRRGPGRRSGARRPRPSPGGAPRTRRAVAGRRCR